MKITEHYISSKKDYNLSFTLFTPDILSINPSTILIAPAMAVTQHYYKKFAEYQCEKGYYVITFDYLGIGLSKINLKDKTIMYQDWGSNINEILLWIASNLHTNIYYVAHSAGGQLLGLAPASKDLIAKIFIISSGIGYWKNWSFPRNYYYLFSWYILFPAIIRLYGYSPKWAMKEKIPYGIIRQWLDWGRKKRFMLDDPTVETYFKDIKAEILFINFSDDTYSTYKNSKALSSFYPEKKLNFLFIKPQEYNFKHIGHFGFFRSKYKEKLWPIIKF